MYKNTMMTKEVDVYVVLAVCAVTWWTVITGLTGVADEFSLYATILYVIIHTVTDTHGVIDAFRQVTVL